jgi:hypothetical protein
MGELEARIEDRVEGCCIVGKHGGAATLLGGKDSASKVFGHRGVPWCLSHLAMSRNDNAQAH